VQVGDFSHVAPQAPWAAARGRRRRAGRRRRVVLPGMRVCDDVDARRGAVVRADITEPGVYAGVPARRVR
jgi:UDP-N-acetylbacillosamine N-acetyltransferase